MSAYPPPPPPPRKLTRSSSNRVIGGVCGGVAEYLNMDANLVRVLTVLISLFTGVPIVLYLVALFLLPEDRAVPPPPPVGGPPPPPAGADVWGPAGAPWEQQPPSPAPEPVADVTTPEAPQGEQSATPPATTEDGEDTRRG